MDMINIDPNFDELDLVPGITEALRTPSICSAKTTRLYLAGNTRWYSKTVKLWLLCMQSLIQQNYQKPNYAASRGKFALYELA